jgi:formylglycine-generating enzyme required for sulfatase activity
MVFPRKARVWFVLVAACVAGVESASTADEPLDRLLHTFLDEFVELQPGKEPYPAKHIVGDDQGPASEQPRYEVRLEPFAINRYETPQNLYEAVTGRNPSRWKGPRNSVENLSWQEAAEFCRSVTRLLRDRKLIGPREEIRLPTEAEWEYACRAGTTTTYSFGDAVRRDGDPAGKLSILDEYAWYTGNAAGNDPAVGTLKPNPWGLYDIHGYLWEFTTDAWTPNHQGAPADGRARPPQRADQPIVVRGGSWKDPADRLRSSARRPFGQLAKDDAVGFRCVRAPIRQGGS